MGRSRDLMEEDAKRAMSMWKARKAMREMQWALEEGARATAQSAPMVMQCTYCGGSCYEGESCSGCGGRQFLRPLPKATTTP